MTAGPVRAQAVDFYRVVGVILIVLGHWIAGSVTYRDGTFGRQNPLLDQPWTQWLTWLFQAVPMFFLVAGYAGAVSWGNRRIGDEMTRQVWVRHRLSRVLGPSAVYVAVVSVSVVAFHAAGTAASLLEYAGWAVAMHLWFLAVYLVVVSLTPIAIAAQHRWGLRAPAALALGVVAADIAALAAHLPYVNLVNYLLSWGLLYQLGIAWQSGLLAGPRAVALAIGSAGALWLLIWLGPYPVSMIGVPGQAVQNTEPPSVAMVAFGCAQAGLVIAAAPVVERALRGAAVRRVLARANANVMALYLWHMIPVVIVAVIAYPAGWLAQPEQGGVAWWLGRLEWVAVLSVVTAAELALLWWGRRVFAAPLPGAAVLARRWAEPAMVAGVVLASYGFSALAAAGFAPSGRFPGLTSAIFAAGVLLVALRSRAPAAATSLRH
ncbi:acyltransferase [Candidatus Mycobacterium wuenschmannii]|uniref:Acyltransferase n=1 Tax=Candidatus Mycobacterium wuenschmannii TaxID=3027808 RepID=A0ABY8W1G7_9MYCO|nr:acyltransferase [Candidatus Mycobacterium wuenschmannii]WIM89065.1 acyltransferase [Candidatus Mycobacterium wuenschmannii]